ncbi:hypothetical protein EYR40_003181 [Pleurotus pulmonarius]|nr:hypothetical protein EYR40_003181 [Pleurotus pulmonarius]
MAFSTLVRLAIVTFAVGSAIVAGSPHLESRESDTTDATIEFGCEYNQKALAPRATIPRDPELRKPKNDRSFMIVTVPFYIPSDPRWSAMYTPMCGTLSSALWSSSMIPRLGDELIRGGPGFNSQ